MPHHWRGAGRSAIASRMSASPPLPFIDLQAQYRRLKPAIDAGIQRVLDHGRFILGPEVAELEAALKQAVDAQEYAQAGELQSQIRKLKSTIEAAAATSGGLDGGGLAADLGADRCLLGRRRVAGMDDCAHA